MCKFCADEVAAGGFGAVDGVMEGDKRSSGGEAWGRELVGGRRELDLSLKGSWRA